MDNIEEINIINGSDIGSSLYMSPHRAQLDQEGPLLGELNDFDGPHNR